MSRVQVVAETALEHGGILGNDGKTTTKVSQANLVHIKAIDTVIMLVKLHLKGLTGYSLNSTVGRLNDSEKGQGQ